MDDATRLTRRLLISAAGAFSMVTAIFGSSARAAQSGSGAAAAGVAPLRTQFVFEARVNIAAAVTIGQSSYGLRRLIPITGGSFSGPRISGEVVPGGADYQTVRPDGVTAVEARYTLRAGDGALIYIANRGILVRGPAQADAPAPISYVRTVPEFEAPIGPHDWLNRAVFVGSLDASQAAAGRVIIRVFQLL